eukprot:m.75382 g.75382  ORF g.75382 m.75382 type:complete len:198 (+) comp8990_c1_seq4:726-1319(+)
MLWTCAVADPHHSWRIDTFRDARICLSPPLSRSCALRQHADVVLSSPLLYVSLALKTTEDELRYKFETFGKLMDVFIPKDRNTGDPRGFGFVTFHDRRDAEDAEEAMNEKEFGGRTIRVNFAKKRPPPEERGRRDDRGGGRGYGGGGGGYGGGGGRDRYDDRRGGGGGGYDDRRGGDRGYDDRRDYGRYDRYDDRRY